MQRTGNLLRPFALRPPTPAPPLKPGNWRTGGCPHLLGRYLTRTARSTQHYRDGGVRPDRLRGGRLTVDRQPCVRPAGHPGPHETAGGRPWQ